MNDRPAPKRFQEIDIQCSGAGGRPYDGAHHVGADHFMMIEPGGTVKRFCDSDCVREHYAFLWQQFQDQLRREYEEMARADSGGAT
jgi:hypothetical protein